MSRTGIDISAGAILLVSAIWFFLGNAALGALIPAVLFHEAGHLLALRATGCSVCGFSVDISGARMDYSGLLSRSGECLCAAAGPAAGFLYALGASIAGNALSSALLLTSSGISLALSVFNLVPALPLDGGRILEALGGRDVSAGLGFICAVLLLGFGLLLFCRGEGIGLFAAGIWLLLAQTEL